MNELQAAATALGSLKAAFDISKTLLDIQGSAKIGAKVIELQSQILSAQQAAMSAQVTQTTLIGRITELEAEVARLKKWEADKSEYRLENVHSGAFVYSPKAEPTATEPNHWLCVRCFESGQRSLLQNLGRTKDAAHSTFGCPTCKNEFSLPFRMGPHRRGEEQAQAEPAPTLSLSGSVVRG